MYWQGPNYRKNFAACQLFCNRNQENTVKNTRRSKVNSNSIRQCTFYLEIQSINRGNPAFFYPSFRCTFRSHDTILSKAVSDEEWLLFLEKNQVLEYFTSPACVQGRGIGRTYIFYCEMLIICRNLTIFSMWL